jgi:predicted acyltransferase
MIIVNNPGDWGNLYAPLQHAPWHGFTPTDLVFPSFLFAVGLSMTFSFSKMDQVSASSFLSKVSKRALIVFMIGVLINWFPFYKVTSEGTYVFKTLDALRIMGVLQRIALCYFFASLILFFVRKRIALAETSAVLLILYWILSIVFAGPGDDVFGLENNAARRLDLWFFTPAHLYKGEGIPFDPEGLLSTLPAVATVLAGYLTGIFLQTAKREKQYLMVLTAVMLITGALVWHLTWPINKKLWTGSYVLLCAGLDLILLWILHYVSHRQQIQQWNFFLVFGRNPLFVFVLADVLIIALYRIRISGTSLQQLVYKVLYASWLEPKMASLAFALTFMMLCWLACWGLDRKKIYLKV